MPHIAASTPGAIHIVVQGKGGVGKSFVASHLAQYFADRGLPTATFDSDPVTPSLARYQALELRYINFMQDDDLDVTRRRCSERSRIGRPASCGSSSELAAHLRMR